MVSAQVRREQTRFAMKRGLSQRRACPPEDVGVSPGYIDFLEAIHDPAHEEHQDMLDWCGGQFDPTAFNPSDTNALLSEIKF